MSMCDECNGTGKVRKCFYEKTANGLQKVWDDVPCEWCNGTGQTEQTNEEWFCNLTTEEKAKYIAKAMYFYSEEFGLTMLEALQRSVEYEQGLNRTLENDVVEWLKRCINEM